MSDWTYSWKLPVRIERTNTNRVSCSCNTVNQNLNIGLLLCCSHQSSRLLTSVPGSIELVYSWYASSKTWYKTQAVTW